MHSWYKDLHKWDVFYFRSIGFLIEKFSYIKCPVDLQYWKAWKLPKIHFQEENSCFGLLLLWPKWPQFHLKIRVFKLRTWLIVGTKFTFCSWISFKRSKIVFCSSPAWRMLTCYILIIRCMSTQMYCIFMHAML